MLNTQDLLNFAKNLAEKTGAMILERYHGEVEVNFKGDNDLVTEVDIEAEQMIRNAIENKYPEHSVYGEEGGQDEKKSDYRWIIDPIDGTTNFSQKHPFFAVSIGLEHQGEIIIGAIYAPYLRELFYAGKGLGAFMNEKPIHVSEKPELKGSLVATGFPPKFREKNLENFSKMLTLPRAIRRCGAASIDFCYVACGRYDAFWELGLKAWDMAAGKVILEEAGGKITNLDGKILNLEGQSVLATNGNIHEEVLGLFN